MGFAKALANEIVMTRKAMNRLYENKAQLNSISTHLGEKRKFCNCSYYWLFVKEC